MFVFGIGALAFQAWLGWMAYQDYTNRPPHDVKDWAGTAALCGGIACSVIVSLRFVF
jgi:hypothetical protein